MTTPPRKVRLAIVSPNPVPYKSPVWKVLHSNLGVDLKVFYPLLDGATLYRDPLFMRDVTWDIPLLDGYPWASVQNRPKPWINWRFNCNVPDIGTPLAEGGFTHILLVGKEYIVYHQALAAARRLGMTTLYRAESHPDKNSWITRRLATLSRRRWYRRIDRFLCVGRYQFNEYAEYGIPPERMFFSPYCVDNTRFGKQHADLLPLRDSIRRDFGFAPDTFVVGYSGKMYPRKNPLELIRALGRIPRREQSRFGLLMVGEGILKDECERLARSTLAMPAAFTGFLNQTELARAYTAMDLFVMPSLWETWGLVLNEAMVFGLPVIATTGVNAARDLIDEGGNGFTYAPGDGYALAALILKVSGNTQQARDMGALSRRRIESYSVEAACHGIMEALENTSVPH
jgi:glycosyltransferase involved in cell wall biosynthesis